MALDVWWSNGKKIGRLFARLNTGEVVEYTQASKTMNHGAAWGDLVFLGEGEYDHTEY